MDNKTPQDTGIDQSVETTTTETNDVGQPVSLMGDKSAPYYGDEYDQRIEKLLLKHEEDQRYEKATEEEKKEINSETLREGESWDSVIENQPPEVQRAMRSLRSDYTRKTQALAEQRKKVQAQTESLLKSDTMQKLKEVASTEGEFDPFDAESFDKYVNKIVAQKLESLLQPIAEQQQKSHAKQKVNTFMDSHPELRSDDEFRGDVKTVLLSNDAMDLETAYWVVRGQRAEAQKHISKAESESVRDRKRRLASLTSAGSRRSASTVPSNLKEMSAWDIYSALKSQGK